VTRVSNTDLRGHGSEQHEEVVEREECADDEFNPVHEGLREDGGRIYLRTCQGLQRYGQIHEQRATAQTQHREHHFLIRQSVSSAAVHVSDVPRKTQTRTRRT
jgi:hypothetical protein